MVCLRAAKIEDAAIVYPWRNDIRVRQFFFNPDEVSYNHHLEWFASSLNQKDRYMFMVLQENIPVGFLRFDVLGENAEIDIYIDPNRQGQGLGTQILTAGIQWAKNHLHDIKKLTGLVVKENIASQRIFEKTGFDLSYLTYEYSLLGSIE